MSTNCTKIVHATITHSVLEEMALVAATDAPEAGVADISSRHSVLEPDCTKNATAPPATVLAPSPPTMMRVIPTLTEGVQVKPVPNGTDVLGVPLIGKDSPPDMTP